MLDQFFKLSSQLVQEQQQVYTRAQGLFNALALDFALDICGGNCFLVERHGGQIAVEPKGQGSSFWSSLPEDQSRYTNARFRKQTLDRKQTEHKEKTRD